jgi:glycosyltransferase involved in cell wall biosynthesis
MPAKPIIVGIDVRGLKTAQTGTRTYLEEICKAFKNIDDESIQFHFLDTSFAVYTGKLKLLKWFGHVKYQLWKQVLLPLKAWHKNCDIVFCTDDCVPFIQLGYKTIPVLHDAFCFESPESYGKLWLWLYLKTAIPAARKAAFVVTPTEYAKKQISRYTHIPDDKLVVIYEGPKTFLSVHNSNGSSILLQMLNIITKEYILHVGSMYKRKNVPALIHAFSEVKKLGYKDLRLVLAGPTPANGIDSDYEVVIDAINALNLQNDVILTGYLSDTEVGELYQNALLYVFPSLNEGFGIPVLEAFKHDIPVIIANNSCLPEIGGDAVLTFNPYSIEDLSINIRMVLDNSALQEKMISKGQERLKMFSWHNTAIQLVKVFKDAVSS